MGVGMGQLVLSEPSGPYPWMHALSNRAILYRRSPFGQSGLTIYYNHYRL